MELGDGYLKNGEKVAGSYKEGKKWLTMNRLNSRMEK
jgi:hypothetical protein